MRAAMKSHYSVRGSLAKLAPGVFTLCNDRGPPDLLDPAALA
jgi:hypothetical protein